MGSRFNSDSKARTRCHIIRNSDYARLVFQFNPTQIPYSRSARYTSIDSPGMSYPLTQYTGGDARTFSFELFYYDNSGGVSSGKINRARRFLESLLPPEYNTSGFTKPPTFTLAYGYFVKNLVLERLDVVDERMDKFGQPIQTRFTLSVRQVGA